MWMVETIGGKTADVYQPAGIERPRFGVLHLHGYQRQTLRDRPAFTRLFDELKLACVCPHGQRSWWTDRICAEFDPAISPEQHLLQQVLPYFQERWQLAPRAIGLQGISMGGQGALRLAFRYPELFPVVAAISPALDFHERYGEGTPLDEMYDSKEQCRQDTAVLHIHPHQQPAHILFCIDPDDGRWLRGNDRLHEKLTALGVAHEIDFTTRGGGHTWEYFERMAERVERFVNAGLEYESRRLL
jgi:S-formylglutathione hydrolase